jgi:putative PIN family toxin of toxin-antitoxin system
MWRAVLDPGVLVAALISKKGAPAQILLRWRASHFELVVSPLLLRELGKVLTRDKFRRYVSLDEAEHYVRMILRGATLITDPPEPPALTPDPGDDYLPAWRAPWAPGSSSPAIHISRNSPSLFLPC